MPSVYIALIVVCSTLLLLGLCILVIWLKLPKIFAEKMRTPFDNSNNPVPDTDGSLLLLSDLEYPSRFHQNKYDLYIPNTASKDSPVPLILWVHGGGFIAGTKDGTRGLMNTLCQVGYAAISMDYATAPEHKYPTAIIQINEMAEYLKKILEDYPQIDGNRIFLCGDSAGGQLCAQYAAIETNEKFAEEMNLRQMIGKERLKGIILVSAPLDIENMLPKINFKLKLVSAVFMQGYFRKKNRRRAKMQTCVKSHVTENFPPTLLTDGNHVSFEKQNRDFGEKLRSVNVLVTELYFDSEKYGKINHEYLFEFGTPASKEGIDAVIKFLCDRS